MIRNFVFDWSGTLCDDLDPVVATSNSILLHYGKETLSREQFLSEFELPYTKYYDRVLPGVPIEDIQQIYLDNFPEDGGKVQPIEGARSFLEAAQKAGCRIFLLTSVPGHHWEAQAKQCGFAEFFEDHVFAAVDKRELLRGLLEKHGLDLAATAYVGDMVHDMEAAREVGLFSFGVATGYEPAADLHKAGAQVVFRDLSEATRFLPPPDRPVSTVGALLHDGAGQVLLFKTAEKWSGTWGIPGGKIERSESSEDALRREIREETGLEIEDIRFVMVQDAIDPPEFHQPAHFLLLNYVAQALPGEVVINEEAEDWTWAPLEKVGDWNLNEPTRVLVKEIVSRGLIPGTAPTSS